jgi:hypothetical protein
VQTDPLLAVLPVVDFALSATIWSRGVDFAASGEAARRSATALSDNAAELLAFITPFCPQSLWTRGPRKNKPTPTFLQQHKQISASLIVCKMMVKRQEKAV